MVEKHSCVVDAKGNYKNFVLAEVYDDGSVKVRYATLSDGDYLVDTMRPKDYVRPKWDGTAWTEGATAEEIAAWEAEHPAPEAPAPSQLDGIEAQAAYTAMMTNTLLEG